jgi:hypothetical protein
MDGNMLKRCGLTAMLLISQIWGQVEAATNTLPQNCAYGRDKSYNVTYNEVDKAIQSGLAAAATVYDPLSWGQFVLALGKLANSFDYLRIEGPNHVLQGQYSRFKGNLFDRYANVNFNTSEAGFVGQDKSNLDANSYLDVKFDKTHGYGLVWITRSNLCSAKGVWVQKQPQVTPITLMSQPGYMVAEVSYSVDPYSQAAKDPAVEPTIAFSWSSAEGEFGMSPSYKMSADKGAYRALLTPQYGGTFTVTARVSDGNFSTNIPMGKVYVVGEPWRPCPTCDIP